VDLAFSSAVWMRASRVGSALGVNLAIAASCLGERAKPVSSCSRTLFKKEFVGFLATSSLS